MVIQHNISSLNSWRNTKINSNTTAKNLEKLSSGFRVNRASDDAAGLAISEKMRGQIRGLAQAKNNIADGISLTKITDGAMQIDHDLLQRARELLVQASNGTYDESDRDILQKEVNQLMQEIDDLSYRAEFNGLKALRTNWEEVVATHKPGNKIPVSIGPGTEFAFGYIDVPADGEDFFINFDNIQHTGASWPDLNLIAPNGDKYGYSWTYLNDSNSCTEDNATSCDKGEYTGWGPLASEQYDFTNAMEGKWIIQLRNYGSSTSTFDLNSDLTIVPYTTGTEGGTPLTIPKSPGPVYIQAGANKDENIVIPIHTIDTFTLGLRDKSGNIGIAVTPVAKANESITMIDDAINFISGKRADIGAVQNRLEHALSNVGNIHENLQAAESSIRDVDMAKEMMEFTKNNILVQASQSMLAQSNQLPQGVLSLLR